MPMTDALLPEFDREMATTRKLLERVPADNLAWKPHAKSMTLGRLASHLAELPGWVASIVNESSFNMTGNPPSPESPSLPDILVMFDKNVATARKTIAAKTDAEFLSPWTLKQIGRAHV